jgi:hypothetical protein
MVEAWLGTDMKTEIERREVWWENGRAGEAEMATIEGKNRGKINREGKSAEKAGDGGKSREAMGFYG